MEIFKKGLRRGKNNLRGRLNLDKAKKVLILFVFFLILVFPIRAVNSAADLTNVESLEGFFDGVVAGQLDEYNIPGASLSLVIDGETIISKGYGYADLEERTPVDPERTLFRPGSASKLITWTAVMQLVERGELDLEADVNQYLDFEIPAKLVKGGEEQPAPITLTHLMTHTPGFEDGGEGLFEIEEANLKTLGDYLKTYLPARIFPPGEVMAYSNYGTALAGYIVERVSGQPFEEYVEENIFNPLGMENSTFRQPLPDHLAPDMARAYKYQGGKYHQGEFEFISAAPAGSMSSTASDMAKFMIAHLQEGRFDDVEILNPGTIREMHTQQFSHHQNIPGMTYGFIEDEINGEEVITHGGATFLFYTGLFLVPEQNIGLFVSYSGGTSMEGGKIFQAFMDRYFPGDYISFPEPDNQAAERALEFKGEYHPNRSNFTSFEKILGIFQRLSINVDEEGYLITSFFGQPARLAEIEPGLYQNVKQDGFKLVEKMGFLEGPGGETILAPGGPMTFSRVPWQGSSMLLGGLTVLTILFALGTFLGWPITYIVRKIRGEDYWNPAEANAARFVAYGFAILTLVMIFGFLAIFGNVDPAYGVPEIMFGETPQFLEILLYIPLVLAVLAVAMLVFSVLSWWRQYWTVGSSLYYTIFTLSALGFMWVLYYTQFFGQLFRQFF